MPPKNKGQTKPRRVPHANETPLKSTMPGHGAVERSKNSMWQGQEAAVAAAPVGSGGAVNKPKYMAGSGISLGIGRGGGTKKKAAPTNAAATAAAVPAAVSKTDNTRPNPDDNFFGKPS